MHHLKGTGEAGVGFSSVIAEGNSHSEILGVFLPADVECLCGSDSQRTGPKMDDHLHDE